MNEKLLGFKVKESLIERLGIFALKQKMKIKEAASLVLEVGLEVCEEKFKQKTKNDSDNS